MEVEEEAGGGHAVQDPHGPAPPAQVPQRPPLRALLRPTQDQQDGRAINIEGCDRLHEGAAREDRAAVGEDGGATVDAETAAAMVAVLLSLLGLLNRNEILGPGTPKLEVELNKGDTWVEIYCTAKPGLLLMTVNAIDTLSLDIHQCVVSCFNDLLRDNGAEYRGRRAIQTRKALAPSRV